MQKTTKGKRADQRRQGGKNKGGRGIIREVRKLTNPNKGEQDKHHRAWGLEGYQTGHSEGYGRSKMGWIGMGFGEKA